jgi:hypothetical protein
MFTGRRWERGESGPADPVGELDPAIDRLIRRCLDTRPDQRPRSALAVAIALPGADPVAAALAAGETPAPEIVAASHEREGFGPRTAVFGFLAVLVCFLAGTVLSGRTSLLARVRLEIPPDVLAFRAGELLSELGYADPPAETAYGFSRVDRVAPVDDSADAASIFETGRPALFRFWYRQHDRPFRSPAIQYGAPANDEPGMKRMLLDPKGRLIELEVRPGDAPGRSDRDWTPALFAAAGLDVDQFQRVEPTIIPPMAVDSRSAWVGAGIGGGHRQVRVEAAHLAGRPVFLSIQDEASPDGSPEPSAERTTPAVVASVAFFIPVTIFLAGCSLAWRNIRQGRADQRGAVTIGGVTFLAFTGQYVVTGHHVLGFGEAGFILSAIFNAGLRTVVAYTLYLAVEPYARRHWPDWLISWNRVLSGRIRDPLVASDVLAGAVTVLVAYGLAAPLITLATGAPARIPLTLDQLGGAAFPVWVVLRALSYTILHTLLLLTLIVLLRLLVRLPWVADGMVAVAFGIVRANAPATVLGDSFDLAVGWIHLVLLGALLVWTMRRFGLVAMAAGLFVFNADVIHFIPGAWFAGRAFVTLAVPVVLAGWALWAILSSRRHPAELWA